MESVQSHATPNWKELAKKLEIYSGSYDALNLSARIMDGIGADSGTLQDKVSDALNMAQGMRDVAFTELVLELTDLDATGARELIQHMTQHHSHTYIARRMAQSGEPPLIKHPFRWSLSLDPDFDDDIPFW